jgi:type II secretory pathway pseudopilin PulG
MLAARNTCDPRRRRGAFTLVEVILAIAIASAILFVLVYFYQQSAELRTQLLAEADRVSSVRLLLNRLEAELQGVPGRCFYTPPLRGDASSIQFIKTELPSRAAWQTGAFGRSTSPETDLRLVKYFISGDSTNVTGLFRSEEPMVTRKAAAQSQVMIELPGATNRPAPPLTSDLKYLRFRYWDGTFWQDSWNLEQMPLGVEVTLAAEPVPEDLAPEETGVALFRRVIHLPASRPIADITSLLPDSPSREDEWPPLDATGGEPPMEEFP